MPRVQPVEVVSRDIPGWVRRVALVVNGLLLGRSNNVYDEVTLNASATETLIEHDQITGDSVALLEPKTATAAAALGVLYQTAATGVITLHHDSTGDTDRSFRYAVVG